MPGAELLRQRCFCDSVRCRPATERGPDSIENGRRRGYAGKMKESDRL